MSILQVLSILEMILLLVPKAAAGWASVMGLIQRAKAGEEISQDELDKAIADVMAAEDGWNGAQNPNAEDDE